MHNSTGSSPRTAPARPHLTSILLSLAVGVLLFCLQVVFWQAHIRGNYFPAGDEFSVIVHSTRIFHASPVEWFRHGFAGYFNPYPDISLAYSNFIRPVDNALFYLNSILWGRNWAAYLLANYAISSALVGVTLFLCLDTLRLSLLTSALIGLSTAVSPAFTAQLIYRPTFAFDYLAALWVLLALLSLARGRFVVAWIAICLGVFSKEPAYFAALGASLVVFFALRRSTLARRLAAAASFLLPLAVMSVLRVTDFRDVSGVYVTEGLSPLSLAKNVLLGVTSWPYILPGDQHIRDLTLHNIASLLLSAILWLLVFRIAYFAILPARRTATGTDAASATVPAPAIVYLFFLGSLIMPLVFDLAPRFGASTFPLLFLSLGCLLEKQGSPRWLRQGLVGLLLLITVIDAVEITSVVAGGPLEHEQLQWTYSRNFARALSADSSPVTFLVDDVSANFSSPESVARFTGYTGRLVPVSNLSLAPCATPRQITLKQIDPRQYLVNSVAPAGCGGNLLYAAYRLDRVSGMTLDRDLPEVTLHYQAADRPREKQQFISQNLTIDLRSKVPHFEILVPDLQSHDYIREIQNPEIQNPEIQTTKIETSAQPSSR